MDAGLHGRKPAWTQACMDASLHGRKPAWMQACNLEYLPVFILHFIASNHQIGYVMRECWSNHRPFYYSIYIAYKIHCWLLLHIATAQMIGVALLGGINQVASNNMPALTFRLPICDAQVWDVHASKYYGEMSEDSSKKFITLQEMKWRKYQYSSKQLWYHRYISMCAGGWWYVELLVWVNLLLTVDYNWHSDSVLSGTVMV